MRLVNSLRTGLASATLAVTATADDKSGDIAAIRKAIATQNARYAEAVTKQDLPTFMALFTAGATVMQVGKTYNGKKERESAAKEQLATTKDPVFERTELDARGDLACEVGKYPVTARAGGEKASGNYLVVGKRQKGGAWLIHVEATLPGGPAKR